MSFLLKYIFLKVGDFDEGKAEDLIFFYKHIEGGGGLAKVEEELQVYRYHDAQASFHVGRNGRWLRNIRMHDGRR